jgi:hypothetical protein
MHTTDRKTNSFFRLFAFVPSSNNFVLET